MSLYIQENYINATKQYERMKELLTNALLDLSILSGDKIGPSDVSWQDVAGTAATNLFVLSQLLHEIRHGKHEAYLVFPSPAECIENLE